MAGDLTRHERYRADNTPLSPNGGAFSSCNYAHCPISLIPREEGGATSDVRVRETVGYGLSLYI